MSEIDIRQGVETKVTSIRFADEEHLEFDDNNKDPILVLQDYNGENGRLYMKDTPNLILALQKALELWGSTKVGDK